METTTYTSLEDLYDTITANIQNGVINLVPDVFNTDPIGTYLSAIIVGNTFTITKAVLDPPTWTSGLESFILSGLTDSLGVSQTIKMKYWYSNAGIVTAYVATDEQGVWSLPGINWFSLSKPFIGATVYDQPLPVVGTAGGEVQVSSLVNVTLQTTYPNIQDSWVLSGIFKEPYPNISNFYQLIGGINLTTFLPQPFSTITDLGLQKIQMSYNTSSSQMEYIGLTMGTSEDYQWTLIPGKIVVEGLGMTSLITLPGSPNYTVYFTITGNFTIGPPGANIMEVVAEIPNYSATVELKEGTIQLGDVFTLFLPGVTIDLQSEVVQFQMLIDPTSQFYYLFTEVVSDWTFLNIPGLISFTMVGMILTINSQQGTTEGMFTGNFHIGVPNGGLDLTTYAGYENAAWVYGAKTKEGQAISLTDIGFTFLQPFGLTEMPEWVPNLSISDVEFGAIIPDDPKLPDVYRVKGTTIWNLEINSFKFLGLETTLEINFTGNDVNSYDTAGTLTGLVTMMGLVFRIGYKFGQPAEEVFLRWEGIVATYVHHRVEQYDLISVSFDNMSLGGIITELVRGFNPGFELPPPWNLLNSIDLSGFSFEYKRHLLDPARDELTIKYDNSINLVFIEFSAFTLTKKQVKVDGKMQGEVFLGFEGSFLGIPIEAGNPATEDLAGEGSNVQDMPTVPGMGTFFFDLQFLGLGQHFRLKDPASIDSVEQAINELETAFKDPQNQLIFDQNSGWLIGADFTMFSFYRMAFVFNDPYLYGLFIGILPQAQPFGGLQFQILYKKINDNIGVYDIRLQLPDLYRRIELGTVSITIPNIGIKIYTNGNFYIDIGWPTSITDFSRSFTLQIFPFTGSGGFYFGYLSGATATGLPDPNNGVFNPVITAGMALSVGLGKDLNIGIFKGGFALTAVGILEGTFAVYNNFENQTDYYYRFSGTVAFTGRLYGKVSLGIISAEFDTTAYVSLVMVIEAYKAIPIDFEVGFMIKLTVTMNLGLFKIKIRIKFSFTFHISFEIGQDRTSQALWNQRLNDDAAILPASAKRIAFPPVTLKWQPIINDTADTYGLDLYFFPQLTVSGEALQIPGYTKGSQYVSMLYLNLTHDNQGTYTYAGMDALASGLLYWAIGALVGSSQNGLNLSWLQTQTVTLSQLELLFCYFDTRPDNLAPFNYQNQSNNDLESFLENLFTIDISAVNASTNQELTASVFPMFPNLQMQTLKNGTQDNSVDFSSYSMTGNQGYIKEVSDILQLLGVDYSSPVTRAYYDNDFCANVTDPDYENQLDLSMATFIFNDFMSLITKQVLQNAIDYLNGQSNESGVIQDIVTNSTSDVQQLAGMASRFMLHGLRLPQPPDVRSGEIQPLYVLTGQQFSIPSLTQGDQFDIQLTNNPSWIHFVQPVGSALQVSLNDAEISRINTFNTLTLSPTVLNGYPKAITNFDDAPQKYSLNDPQNWDYPAEYFSRSDQNPTLWKLPPDFAVMIAQQEGQALGLELLTLTKEGNTTKEGKIHHHQWGTFINVTLQNITSRDLLDTPIAGNVYQLVGADDTSIALLEQMLKYLNTNRNGNDDFITQINALMIPDPTTGDSGYVSAAGGALNMAIVQANLSTETNPPPALRSKAAVPAQPINTLNTPGDFITLLWECSIVRSGGYYFYYITEGDSKGLPDYLFTKDGNAQLQLLITYDDFIAYPFINAVVTGDSLDLSKTIVYAETKDVTVRVATLPPGAVGYELARKNPGEYRPTTDPPSPTQDQTYLQQQFNLLGVTLPSTIYQNYLPAGPVNEGRDDIDDIDDYIGEWYYNSVIPYYKFVQDEASNINHYPNPYAGLGDNVAMQLNWQDMFGNLPNLSQSLSNAQMQLLYTDPIVALSMWPSLTGYFLFTTIASTPTLQLSLCFDVTRYQEPDTARNNASIDLETYVLLYYQLTSGDLAVSYRSTIDGTQADKFGPSQMIDTNDLVTNFVTPIIDYLQAVVVHGTASPSGIPSPYQGMSNTVDPSQVASYSDTIPLMVNFSMQRTAHVDPNFQNVESVVHAVTPLEPQAKANACEFSESNNDSLSLQYFAQQFESTFQNQPTQGILLKVATTTNLEQSASSVAQTPSLWFVRFDNTGTNGIYYTYDNSKAFFFAPIPLSTSLISLQTAINSYQTGQPYPVGSPVVKSFVDVDLDAWGEQFLNAVDAVLAPGLAVPAFLLDNGVTLQYILDAKQTLAEAIEGTIDFIMETSNADKQIANIGNAQEKWKQQILISLGATYKYSAAVQTPVQVQSSYTGTNNEPPTPPYVARLYGDVVGEDPSNSGTSTKASTEYSLSTAKLPLGNGDSWLTYLFETKDTPEYRSFAFKNIQYQVSHLEQDMTNVPGIDDYLASTWLTFVIPIDNIGEDVGPVEIPVVLRSYPTPPSVTSQQPEYPTQSNIETIDESRTWNFEYMYTNAVAAQDTIETQVELNVPAATPNAQKALDVLSLDDALAQFVSVYPQINQDFQTYLAQLTQQDVMDGTDVFINAKFALNAFVKIVGQVAMAWGQWNQVNPRTPQPISAKAAVASQEPIRLLYTMEELQDDGELVLTVVPSATNPFANAPTVNIPGYETVPVAANSFKYKQGNQFLSFDDRNKQPLRQVILPGLNIFNEQNAWAGALIIRNADLLQNNEGGFLPTNPRFIYQTPLVKFYDKLIPALYCPTVIDIATIGTATYPVSPQRTLADQMGALFDALTDGVNAAQIEMKMNIAYKYVLADTSFAITVPVLLATPFALTTSDQGSSFATQLTNNLNQWLDDNIADTSNGTFEYTINVFSNYDPNILVFQLSLKLAMSSVSS
ncbi:MAG TPA: hypothetical protein DCS93_01345 [Microscillaceae bacterium]|nr:hypothetical protein [Microscillaceae bacterium]